MRRRCQHGEMGWRGETGVSSLGFGRPGSGVRGLGAHTGNASRDDNDVCVLERGLSAIVGW